MIKKDTYELRNSCPCFDGALYEYVWLVLGKTKQEIYKLKQSLTVRVYFTSRAVVMIKSFKSLPHSADRMVFDAMAKIISGMRTYTAQLPYAESSYNLDKKLFVRIEVSGHYERLARSIADKVNGVVTGEMKGQLNKTAANELASKIFTDMWHFSNREKNAFWLSEAPKRVFIRITADELGRVCNALHAELSTHAQAPPNQRNKPRAGF